MLFPWGSPIRLRPRWEVTAGCFFTRANTGRTICPALWWCGINGEEGIPIPGELVDATHFKQVYSHPAANGRSRGAALSDLFWYWLSPGPEMHQEHLEPGKKYEEVARTTGRMLAIPMKAAE